MKGCQRVVGLCDKMPEEMAETGTVMTFKRQVNGNETFRGGWVQCRKMELTQISNVVGLGDIAQKA